jgi:uncharacterized membrane protein
MYHPFSITQTLSIAWHILKKNFAAIAVYTLLAFIVIIATSVLINFILINAIMEVVAIILFLVCVSLIFSGFVKLIFQLIDKEYYDFDFKDILPKIKVLLSYMVLMGLISTLAVFVPKAIKTLDDGILKYLLGIFFGFFIETFCLFYFPICTCFIIDDNSGPFESVIQSFQLIRGNFFKYFLLFVIIEGIVFLGAITVIGMIFVVPFVYILLVVAYRKLVYSRLDVDDDVTETI